MEEQGGRALIDFAPNKKWAIFSSLLLFNPNLPRKIPTCSTEIRFNLLACLVLQILFIPEPGRSVDCCWLETHWFTGILRSARVRVQYLWYLLRKLILDMPPFFVGIFPVSLAGQGSGLIKPVSSSYTAINLYKKIVKSLNYLHRKVIPNNGSD